MSKSISGTTVIRHIKKVYEYTPLADQHHIRTLKLLRKPITDDIEIEFSALSLNEAAHEGYYALSYTWGSAFNPSQYSDRCYGPKTYDQARTEEAKFFVKVHGHSLPVSENLFDALQHFRKIPAFENQSLWIDALCINQGDVSERSSQVSFMGNIYASASKVIVWLGKGDRFSEIALPLVEGLIESLWSDKDENVFRKLTKGFQQYATFNDPCFFQDVGHRPFTNDEWIAIAELHKRRWFFRLWVIQEVVLVKNTDDVVLFCGSKRASYEHFEFFSLIMWQSGWWQSGWWRGLGVLYENGSPLYTNFGFEIFHRARRIRPYVEEGPNSSRLHPLLSQWTPFITEEEKQAAFCAYILDYTRDLEVTDPLDRLYAIRDIFGWHVQPSRSGMLALIPFADYNIDTVDLYTTLARNMIEQSHSLFFLSYVEDKWRTWLPVPSWVPDLSVPMSPLPIIGSLHKYKAALGWDWNTPQFEDKGRILVIDGLHLDNIEECSKSQFPQLVTPESFLDFLTFFIRSHEISGIDLMSLLRTMLTDCLNVSAVSNKPENYPWCQVKASFQQWLMYQSSRAITKKRQSNSDFEIPSFLLDENLMVLDGEQLDFGLYFARYLSLKESGEHGAEFRHEIIHPTGMFINMIDRTTNRRLFRSTKHNTIGLTAPKTRKGDQLWLLCGGDVPYVLRENEDGTYSFRGECYLDGFMNGEAFAKDDGIDIKHASKIKIV